MVNYCQTWWFKQIKQIIGVHLHKNTTINQFYIPLKEKNNYNRILQLKNVVCNGKVVANEIS
jgi:hypothetical protein